MEVLSTGSISLPRLGSDVVQRPWLQARLRDALSHFKLVLLCAPAGCGKTVSLVQALRFLPADHGIAWVSAGEEDDLPRVLSHLLAALDPFDLPWRISPEALPSMVLREGGLAAVVAEIARALEQAESARSVIALDDAHRIVDPRVFDFVERLLKILPDRCVLAMTSREDPPLPVARMAVTGELRDFRAEDLRFRREDVLALLETARQPASDESIDVLLQRTQGWAVALNIELRARRGPSHDARTQWRTFDYLAQEVLDQLPVAMQEFLLRCSVLPELSIARCAHVSADARSAHWLDELERRALFVTVLESQELRLRLHDLFREFLQAQLSRRLRDEVPDLLRRAADGEPDLVQRVKYLLQAGAPREAARQMPDAAASMIHSGRGEHMLGLIDRFPEPLKSTLPELAFVRGMVSHFRLQYRPMLASMLEAMEGFQRAGQQPLSTLSRALACAAQYCAGQPRLAFDLWDAVPTQDTDPQAQGLRAVVDLARSAFFGPWASTPEKVWQLVSALPQIDAENWMPYLHTRHMSIGRWGVRPAMEALASALSALAGESRPQLKLAALQLQAWLAFWQGDVERARELSRELTAEARWLGNPPYALGFNAVLSAFERHVCGDHAKAKVILLAVADGSGRDTLAGFWALCHLAGLCVACGDWSDARELLASIDSLPTSPEWPFLQMETQIVRAELALHDGREREAVEWLHPMLEHAMDWDNHGMNARLRVSLARAQVRCGNPAGAWTALAPALSQAMETGEPMALWMCGPAALGELAQVRWPDTADAGARDCLATCAERARRLHAMPAVPPPSGNRLSERELQVIALVAQGRSNKLIARDLGLSPHTVKRHMARILDKTGLASRGRLAQWHRAQSA